MDDLKKKISEGVTSIAGREVGQSENLFGSAIDSMSLVEVINLVEDLAKERKLAIDLDAMISEDSLSIDDIYQIFQKASQK